MKRVLQNVLIPAGILFYTTGSAAAELGEDYTSKLCPTALDIPNRPVVETNLEPGDTFMTADEADLIEKGLSTLTGNAEVSRDTQQVRADEIRYDEPKDTADLDGNVNYWDEALYLQSNEAYLQFDSGIGEFDTADFTIIDSRGRGKADRLLLDVGTRTEMDNVRYTTCDPDDEFWSFSASKLELDHEENWGKARNVVLRIKDFPVFYTPYMSFPLSNERKSGFLAPSYGSTNRHGFQLETPYYWNIAPQMDATFAPRLYTDSGVMATGEYRYMFKRGAGQINAEYLPSDNKRDDDARNFFAFQHDQDFLDTGKLSLTYTRVSDKFYFEDFGGQISVTSTRYLPRLADVSYRGKNYGHSWDIRTRVQDYQTVDRSIEATDRPYKRLPQVLFNMRSPRRYGALNYGLKTETVYFERGDNVEFTESENVNGLRVQLKPYMSFPMRTMATYLEPKVSLDYTQYDLDSNTAFSDSPSRVLPIVSVDAGMFLERETRLFKTDFIQTLEPRIYYLYVPEEDQSDLPIFDSGEYTFSFNSLFRDNRFSGNDRQGDANQITVAVSSHLINQKTGRDWGNISLGQIFYFHDREVTRNIDDATRDEDFSAFVAEANAKLIKNWEFTGNLIWDPNVSDSTQIMSVRAKYSPSPGKILNLSYRVNRERTDIEQSDISFRWPISQKLSFVGRWNYAVPEGRSLETFGGIEYESCCFGIRAVARRYLTDVDGDFQNGVFVQMELKGLAGIGKKTVDFLQQQIPGYKSEF